MWRQLWIRICKAHNIKDIFYCVLCCMNGKQKRKKSNYIHLDLAKYIGIIIYFLTFAWCINVYIVIILFSIFLKWCQYNTFIHEKQIKEILCFQHLLFILYFVKRMCLSIGWIVSKPILLITAWENW